MVFGFDKMLKGCLHAPTQLGSIIRTKRDTRDIKSRSIMTFEQAGHEIRYGVVTKICRDISNADSIVVVHIAAPNPGLKGRIFVPGPKVGALKLIVRGRGASEQ